MELKFFFGNQARGLKRAHTLFGITREDLDFEGKIERLARDSKIEAINGSIFGEPPRRHYKIKLNQSLTEEEILSLTTKYRFAKPIDISENEDMKCTEHSLYTEVIFPYPHQRLRFIQPPYKIKE
jgi:tRNA G10  N-methylase Trm11